MSSNPRYQPPLGPPPKSKAQSSYQRSYQPGPSAPYVSGQLHNEAGYVTFSRNGGKQEYGAPLEINKRRVNDVAFLVLFILQFCGFIAISVLVLLSWVKEGGLGGGIGGGTTGSNTGTAVTLNQHTVFLLLLVTAAGLVLATTYLIIVRAFTKIIVHITLILSVALNIGVCVYYWITRYYSGAIIFTIIAIFKWLIWGKSYFPFWHISASAGAFHWGPFLQVTIDVSKHHLSVYVVAFCALIVQSALAVWFSFVTISTYAKYTPGNPSCSTGTRCSSSTVAGLIFFEIFSFLWTSQVVGNVALATLAGGPYGAWYYYGPRSQGNIPAHPTLSAFTRASTLSLGSIAFGSLVVTILEVIRIILNALRQNADAEGHPVEACLACCAEYFVGCIESLVRYFNRYAYIEIALYGMPYIEAAKDTWRLFKDRGIDAIVNDSIVGITLTYGAYLVGLLSSLFGYLYLRFTHPLYNTGGQYTAPVVLFAFLIGLLCSLTLASVIEAGVSTLFVGLGEDPQLLAERAPLLFEMIRREYPQVVQSVPRDDI